MQQISDTNDDDDQYLPDYVYPNWLTLAARVAAEADDRDEWRRWATERIAPRLRPHAISPATPSHARRARRIGYMADAEPAGAQSAAPRRHW